MSDWIAVPCLLSLRSEFNIVSPRRDKGADGTIGDTAHAAGGTSDHLPDEDFPALRGKDADKINEVHGLDVDSSGPWPFPGWFDHTVKAIIASERARWLDPNDLCRLEYVIWDRKIYSRSHDFEPRPYTGADPHTNHAHFSARYITQAENDTRPWGVAGEDDMPTAKEIAQAVADFEVYNPYTKRMQKLSEIWGYTPSRSPHDVTHAKLDSVSAVLIKASQGADVDEAEVARLVLTGLTPERLGAAIVAAGLTPELLAQAIPLSLAAQVADILAARLAA